MKKLLIRRFEYDPYIFYDSNGNKSKIATLTYDNDYWSLKITVPRKAIYSIKLYYEKNSYSEDYYIRIENKTFPTYIGSIHNNSDDEFNIPLQEGENVLSFWHTIPDGIVTVTHCVWEEISEEISQIFYGDDLVFGQSHLSKYSQGYIDAVKGYTLRYSSGYGDTLSMASEYPFFGEHKIALCFASGGSNIQVSSSGGSKAKAINTQSSSHQNCKYLLWDLKTAEQDFDKISSQIISGAWAHIGAIVTHKVT